LRSAATRISLELVALAFVVAGAVLARFDSAAMIVVVAAAVILIALVELVAATTAPATSERPSERTAVPRPESPPASAPAGDAAEPPPPRSAEPRVSVSERTALAILGSVPPPSPLQSKPPRRARRPIPKPPPEQPRDIVPAESLRTWNVWDLERTARDAADDPRHEEWNALLIYLREFANADGDLPIEFDRLVNESFAGVVELEPATS